LFVDPFTLTTTLAVPVVRALFETIMKERRVRKKDLLQNVPDEQKAQVQASLDQLKEARLIKENPAPADLEDFKSYSATAEGLLAERALKAVAATAQNP
jgi:hypothetical protein